MKTLKKTLCLVLAVVMAVGVLILPANAASSDVFTDIDGNDYKAAINQLGNYGIVKGKYNNMYYPDDTVTRAEVTAMLYRIMTGDTADTYVGNSASYATKYFPKDMFTTWQLGPVGFAANGEYIKGKGDGMFYPNANVTGYELLAIMLRAVGYGQNHEYEGAKWQLNTITDARQLGILTGVKGDMKDDLNRGQVAQIVANAIKVPRVQYYNGKYSPFTLFLSIDGNKSTELNVSLVVDGTFTAKQNTWGIPTETRPFIFTYPIPDDGTQDYSVTPNPVYDSWVERIECEVYDEVKPSGSSFDTTTFTNGTNNVDLLNTNKTATDQNISATDTTHTIGKQGRHTQIYVNPATKGTTLATYDPYLTIYVDYFLAVVTSTTAEVKDPANHVINKATAYLDVYRNNEARVPLTIDNTSKGYVKGDVLMVTVKTAAGNAIKGGEVIDSQKITPVTLTVKSVGVTDYSPTSRGVAITGTDNVVHKYNHTFGYNTTGSSFSNDTPNTDAVGCTYNFYFDSQGNILGVAPATVNNYGVITSVGVQIAGVGQYYNQYVIKTASGDVTVNQIRDDGAYYTSSNTAEAGQLAVNTLVYYAPNMVAPEFVSLTKAPYMGSLTGYAGNPGTRATSFLDAGRSNMFSSISGLSGLTVNNNTVFFVATYAYNEHSGTYVQNGIDVYSGFTAVPDLALYFGATGTNVAFTDVATGGRVTRGGLLITAVDVGYNGTPNAARPDTIADYVFVQYANHQATPEKLDAGEKYAFLLTKDAFADVSNSYWSYNAIIEGTAGQTLNVTRGSGAGLNTHFVGLYTYDDSVNNNSYVTVRGPVNQITAANKWTYAAGVLTITGTAITNDEHATPAGAPSTLTVTPDAQVYLVNPVTGTSTLQPLSVLEDGSPYAYTYDTTGAAVNAKYDITLWYQYNEYGWVDLIYLVAVDKDPTPPVTPAEPYDVLVEVESKSQENIGIIEGASTVTTKKISTTTGTFAFTITAYKDAKPIYATTNNPYVSVVITAVDKALGIYNVSVSGAKKGTVITLRQYVGDTNGKLVVKNDTNFGDIPAFMDLKIMNGAVVTVGHDVEGSVLVMANSKFYMAEGTEIYGSVTLNKNAYAEVGDIAESGKVNNNGVVVVEGDVAGILTNTANGDASTTATVEGNILDTATVTVDSGSMTVEGSVKGAKHTHHVSGAVTYGANVVVENDASLKIAGNVDQYATVTVKKGTGTTGCTLTIVGTVNGTVTTESAGGGFHQVTIGTAGKTAIGATGVVTLDYTHITINGDVEGTLTLTNYSYGTLNGKIMSTGSNYVKLGTLEKLTGITEICKGANVMVGHLEAVDLAEGGKDNEAVKYIGTAEITNTTNMNDDILFAVKGEQITDGDPLNPNNVEDIWIILVKFDTTTTVLPKLLIDLKDGTTVVAHEAYLEAGSSSKRIYSLRCTGLTTASGLKKGTHTVNDGHESEKYPCDPVTCESYIGDLAYSYYTIHIHSMDKDVIADGANEYFTGSFSLPKD